MYNIVNWLLTGTHQICGILQVLKCLNKKASIVVYFYIGA